MLVTSVIAAAVSALCLVGYAVAAPIKTSTGTGDELAARGASVVHNGWVSETVLAGFWCMTDE
jgi:hypothetical protein